ncbi:hypothetical protein EDC04DRAFT_2612049 [Pisolithus marmoratus]|nr:hypothetical protein EDC04DRAFT_2612049 [Pisolithus marmoratus]
MSLHGGTKNKSAIPLLSTKPTRYSRGQYRGLEVPEEGNGGDMNRSFKYQKGTKVVSQGQGVCGPEGGRGYWSELWGARGDCSCCSSRCAQKGEVQGSQPKQDDDNEADNGDCHSTPHKWVGTWLRAEEAQDKNAGGRLGQDDVGDVGEHKRQFLKGRGNKAGKQVLMMTKSEEHLTKKVQGVAKPERKENPLGRAELGQKKWKVVSTPGQASEVVMKAGPGEVTKQWNE